MESLEAILNDKDFDMSQVEITNFVEIDCLSPQPAPEGEDYSGEDLAMQLYNQREAEEDLKSTATTFLGYEASGIVGGLLLGFLLGGPVGAGVGVVIGFTGGAAATGAEMYFDYQDTVSMDRAPDAGIYYDFEVNINATVPVQKQPYTTSEGEVVESSYYYYYYDMDINGTVGPNTEVNNSLNQIEYDSIYMQSPIAPSK